MDAREAPQANFSFNQITFPSNLFLRTGPFCSLSVILGAFVHYHGISEMAMYRLKRGDNCNSLGGEAPVIPVSSSAADIMAEKLEIGGAVF